MMGYLKFFRTETGSTTVARVYAGDDHESAVYAGTVAVPAALFEQMLDALTYGAREVHRGELVVREGPDARDFV